VHVGTATSSGNGGDGKAGPPPALSELPAGRVASGQAADARLLCDLLQSPHLAPCVAKFFRLVTGCPSFTTETSGGGGTRWHVHFKADMPTCFAPETHICFQPRYLSAAPYTRDKLARDLIFCAQHCTAFGQQ